MDSESCVVDVESYDPARYRARVANAGNGELTDSTVRLAVQTVRLAM